jgi:DNA-binding transcriptional LysR family regulator
MLGELLLNGSIEVAIYGLPEGIEDSFHALPLFRERFVIAFSPNHRFFPLNAVRGAELNGEAYVNRSNCEYGSYAGTILRSQGVEVKRVIRSSRDDWVQAMVLADFGFGFFPQFSVTLPGLETRPLIEPELERTVNLVTVRGRPHSPAVGALLRAARMHKWPVARTGEED